MLLHVCVFFFAYYSVISQPNSTDAQTTGYRSEKHVFLDIGVCWHEHVGRQDRCAKPDSIQMIFRHPLRYCLRGTEQEPRHVSIVRKKHDPWVL